MKAEVLAGPERRRRWGSEEKAGIVAETGVDPVKPDTRRVAIGY